MTTSPTPAAATAEVSRPNNSTEQGTSALGITPPPKLRRGPMVYVIAIATICLGALICAWAFTTTSNAQDVIAVRQTIERGSVIDRKDLVTVKVGLDPALKPMAASQIDAVVGKRAVLDIPAGGVLTAGQIADAALPPAGESIVGISLTPAMLPAGQVRVGDQVRVVNTPGDQGTVGSSKPETIEAVVSGVTLDETTGNTVVNVQVPHDDAARVAALASTGKAAIILDSRER